MKWRTLHNALSYLSYDVTFLAKAEFRGILFRLRCPLRVGLMRDSETLVGLRC